MFGQKKKKKLHEKLFYIPPTIKTMRHKGINNTTINSARRILKQAYYV